MAVIVWLDEFEKLPGERKNFRMFLLSGPSLQDVDLDRSKEHSRDIEL